MSDILHAAGAVLSKTRFVWAIPSPSNATAPSPLFPDGQILMNKKTHTTHDVPGKPPGGFANDHNKPGHNKSTPLHQDQRSPASRSDRDDHLGSHNQSQERKHPPGQAR
jgi:hypothetical protein